MIEEHVRRLRCAVYTRKSSEEGLDQAFNSLDAQREACEAYIKSQGGEGWRLVRSRYDDGGISGGTMERPALQQLLSDIKARKVDTIVVYKVDRLTRSLADFAKIVEVLDAHKVSFVSVTQAFNTTTSMGRLTLNMLLSFAQFEREVTSERIRDKIAASKKKGMWMGGNVPLGYDARDRSLVINEPEADTVRTVFRLYLERESVRAVKSETDRLGLTTKIHTSQSGRAYGGSHLSRGHIYKLLGNPLYAGRIAHKGETYDGQHAPIIDHGTWEAVKVKLAANAIREGANAAEPSLLAGLIYDERGNRFSPSFSVKKGRRYHYYVSQAVLQQRKDAVGQVGRIPAREIEDLIGARLRAFLGDPGQLIDELGETLTPRHQQRLMARAEIEANRWPQTDVPTRRAFLKSVGARVTVGEENIRLTLGRDALRKALLGDSLEDVSGVDGEAQATGADTDDVLTFLIPARLKRCGLEMRLVIPVGGALDLRPYPDEALIKALIRAYGWKDRLVSGEALSIHALAKEDGIDERYLSRVLRLAFLAPDITEAILDGYQPAELGLDKVLRRVPLTWADQRQLFRTRDIP